MLVNARLVGCLISVATFHSGAGSFWLCLLSIHMVKFYVIVKKMKCRMYNFAIEILGYTVVFNITQKESTFR